MSVASQLTKDISHNKSKQSCTSIGTSAKTGSIASKSMFAMRASPTRHRHKVRDFNSLITCSLCHGYLVNATTIDNCLHSYCRSCIIKHLKKNKHCPQCRPSSKIINFINLRSDRRLKSLVYKLVPGLYQREQERYLDFILENQVAKEKESFGNVATPEEDDDFFSPVEPISLSLEYHPKSLMSWHTQQIPSIRYLQCPAAVTVQHLKRFIASKFNIDMDNERVDIEIIYENEVLPGNFSLMDVGYCYLWKRTAPMRFFYRILIHNLCNTNTSQVDLCDKALNEENSHYEAKCKEKSKETDLRKSVRFKESDNNDTSTGRKENDVTEEEKASVIIETEDCDFFHKNGSKFESVSNYISAEDVASKKKLHRESGMRPNKSSEDLVCENKKEKNTPSDSNDFKPFNSMKHPECKSNNANNKCAHISSDDFIHKSKHNNSYCSQKHMTVANHNNNNIENLGNHISNLNDANVESKRTDLNATIIKKKRFSDVSVERNKIKITSKIGKKDHRDLEKATREKNGCKADTQMVADAKFMLKTKDISVKNFASKTISTFTNGAEVKKTKIDQVISTKTVMSETFPAEDSMKKCDIFVSIPPMSRPLSVTSENGLDNLPLSQLKTANKKNSKILPTQQNYENYQKHSEKEKSQVSSSSYDDHKPDLPKLKIELSGMKTKFMIAKRPSDEKCSSKSSIKSPKHNLSFSSTNLTNETSRSKNDPLFKISKSPQESALSTNAPIAHVDLTTYAKNIGLKPIYQEKQERTHIEHSSGEAKEKVAESEKITTDMSTSSIPTCIIDDSTEGSEMQCQILPSHKKRKKEKHSKELGSNKKRRIHAEISSQHIDKSLKLKVKITANHKSYKTEKKVSSENDSKESIPTSPPVTIPISLPTASHSIADRLSSTNSSTCPKLVTDPTETSSGVSILEKTTTCKPWASLERSGFKDSITLKGNENTGNPNPVAPATKTSTILNNVEEEKEAPRKVSSCNDKPPEKRSLPRMPRIKHTLLMPNQTRISSDEQSKQFSHLIKQCANNRIKTSSMISISEVYSVPRLETVTTSPSKSINYTLITSSNPIITPTIDSSSPACVVTPAINLAQLPQSQRVRLLHDAKISPSPPLPPSLFKTAPMQMQPLIHCPVKPNPVQTNKPKPLTQIEPRVTFQGDLSQAGKGTCGQFPVFSHSPIPPKPIQNNSHATGIISTNPSSQSLLKRPTPDSLLTVAKQRKIEQNQSVKKQITSSSLSTGKVRTSGTFISSVYDKPAHSQPNSYTHFVNSPLSPTYAQVTQDRKQTTVVIPTCSVSVTKMTDGLAENTKKADGRMEQNKRPAFEIVRIHSNIPPVDKQKLTVTANNTIKQSHLKTVRPPPPPIPLVKIKRPSPQSSNISTAKIEDQSRTSAPMPITKKDSSSPCKNTQKPKNETLTDSVKDIEGPKAKENFEGSPSANNLATSLNDAESKKTDDANNDTIPPVCDKIGALDLSGKSSRSPSVEKTVLLNTPPTTPTVLTAEDQTCTSITPLQNVKVEINASLLSKLGLHVEKAGEGECQTSLSLQEPLKSPAPAIDEKSTRAPNPLVVVKSESVSTTTDFKKESLTASAITSETTSPKTPQTPVETFNNKPKITSKSSSEKITKSEISTDSKARELLEGRSNCAKNVVLNNDAIPFSVPTSFTSLYSSNNLQNLKMLSESAIAREKLTIKNLRQVPMLSKLNDKMRQNSTVRQQNASVRNIPNPSALALRNCPSMPMLAVFSKSSSANQSKQTEKTSEISLSSTTNGILANKKNGADESEGSSSCQIYESAHTQNQQHIPKIDLTLTSPCGSPVPFSTSEQEQKPSPQTTTTADSALQIDVCKLSQSIEAEISKKEGNSSNENLGDLSPSSKKKVPLSANDSSVAIEADFNTTTAVSNMISMAPTEGDGKKHDVTMPLQTSSTPTTSTEKTGSSTPRAS